MRDHYRRMKGWNGTVYTVRMTEAEVIGRRKEIAFWIGLAGILAFAGGVFLAMIR